MKVGGRCSDGVHREEVVTRGRKNSMAEKNEFGLKVAYSYIIPGDIRKNHTTFPYEFSKKNCLFLSLIYNFVFSRLSGNIDSFQ